MQDKHIFIKIAPQAIIAIILSVLGLWVLYQIRDIIVLFLIIVAIVVTLSPVIRSWEKHIARQWAIALLYAILILVFIAIFSLLLPPVFSQINELLQYLDGQFATNASSGVSVFSQLRQTLSTVLSQDTNNVFGSVFTQFQSSLNVVYSGAVNVISAIVGLGTIFVTSYYLLSEEKRLYGFLSNLIPTHKVQKANEVMQKISDKMGGWLRGQLLLMLIVGVMNGVALAILGVPYALLLGLWAGLTEFLPYVGPILGAIPGAFLAFSVLGMTKGFIAIAIYLVVQQIETHFLVPKIMGKALGLSPLFIIFALLIGGKLLGFIGLIIGVPIAAVLSVIYEEWIAPMGAHHENV